MTPLVQKMAKRTPDAHTFMWFDIGQIKPETVELVLEPKKLTHLPFDRTAVVGTDRLGWEFSLVLFGGNGSVFFSGWSFGEGNWTRLLPFGWADTDEGLKLIAAENRQLPPRDECLQAIAIVDIFLTHLQTAAAQAYRASVPATHLNRVRMAKGKPPFKVVWNTVVIAPSKPSIGRGGTHASPRQHQRRGHWRTRGDKRHWVRQATVGKAENGSAFKDYAIKARSEA